MKSEFISWVQISESNSEQVVHIMSPSQSCTVWYWLLEGNSRLGGK